MLPTINCLVIQCILLPKHKECINIDRIDRIIPHKRNSKRIFKKEGFTLKINKFNCQIFICKHFHTIFKNNILENTIQPWILKLVNCGVKKPFTNIKGKVINIHSSAKISNFKGFCFSIHNLENLSKFFSIFIEEEPGNPDIPLTSSNIHSDQILTSVKNASYIKFNSKTSSALTLKIQKGGCYTILGSNIVKYLQFTKAIQEIFHILI